MHADEVAEALAAEVARKEKEAEAIRSEAEALRTDFLRYFLPFFLYLEC